MGCHFLLQCTKVKSESEVAQSCPTLLDPMDCSLPGSSAHGIFQARVLEWGAISFSEIYIHTHIKRKKKKSKALVIQLCPTLSDLMDCSLPRSSIHGIFQARVLEWGAIAFSGIYTAAVAAAAKSLQSCPTLCDPIDGSPPGAPIHRILQARTLEWVAISFSNA